MGFLQYLGVAVSSRRGVWEKRCAGPAVCGSHWIWEWWPVKIQRGSCVVGVAMWELRRLGVAVHKSWSCILRSQLRLL